MNISETCREIIKEIDAKTKTEKIRKKQITYKVDEASVVEAIKFFNLTNQKITT